jgi:hypothetical protein
MTSTLNYESTLAPGPIAIGSCADGTRVFQRGFSVTADTYGIAQDSTAIDLKANDGDVPDSQIATSTNDSIADKEYSPLEVTDQKVLEYYFGKVEQVTDGIALVCLTTPAGEKLIGKYSASELEKKDIRDGDWFDCETVEEAGKISVRITKRKRIPLSDQMLRRMDEELDIDFAGLE